MRHNNELQGERHELFFFIGSKSRRNRVDTAGPRIQVVVIRRVLGKWRMLKATSGSVSSSMVRGCSAQEIPA